MTSYQEDQMRRLRAIIAEYPSACGDGYLATACGPVPAVWQELEKAGEVTICRDGEFRDGVFARVSPK